MAQSQVSESDEGKRVVDENGTEIGVVSGVKGGLIYVDPDPGIADKLLAKLGWENIESDDYTINQTDVEQIDDEEIRLKQ
ncbi:MAG: PRC-barrel domain containing protein [Halolamina sp.]